MTRQQRSRLISRLNERSQVEAFGAAKEIWQEPDPELEHSLIQTLKNGRRPFNRAAAAYAMQIITTPRTVRALEQTLMNKGESPRVRGEAAEALAHFHRRKSHNLLLRGLADSSKEVCFWSAFALGEMAEKRALSSLMLLVKNDKRMVKGFHSVSKEAANAIANIVTEKIDHRRKRAGCVFCIPS